MMSEKEVRRIGKEGNLDQNEDYYFNYNELKRFYQFISEEDLEFFIRFLFYMVCYI